MITNKDSLGNELSKEQIEYFKDTKIVDSHNNLLVCYHGSPNPGFKEFNPKDSKSQFGRYKFGSHNVNYFTTDEDSANSYGSNRYKVYINIKNPYILKSDDAEDMRTSFSLKDNTLRKKQLKLFDDIFNKWLGAYIDYTDPRFNELNKDLNKLNFELRPSDVYSSDAEPDDIELFDLYDLGKNSKFGAEHIVEYEYYTHELFDEDMYDELKNIMVGEDEEDYVFTTDDIVRYVLMLDKHYDGIIIENIFDSASYFGGIGTDIITLESSNQIKSIDNKTPTTSNRIDEVYVPYISDKYLLWKGANYSQTPKTDKIRLYHQTDKKNIQSIIKNGIQGKFKREFDNPGGEVIWASDQQPTDPSDWSYGNCIIEFDLPKDFDYRKVNNSDYHIYQDVLPKYINAIYLQSNYRQEIMKDFQNTLDLQKSIDRFMKGELNESIDDLDFDPDELAQLIDIEEIDDLYEPDKDDDNSVDKNSDWYKSMLDTINQSRKFRKGTTFKLSQEDKEYLQKYYPDYSFKIVELKDVIEKNNLDNPEHGAFSRRTSIWGNEPELYWYSKDKDNERYNPIRLTNNLKVMDGNHRLWALYNMGYKNAEVLVKNNSINESLLLEVSRRELINKSRKGADYSAQNQDKGKNRWERKKWSKVANTTKEFNSIDMNTFFKKDILIVNVPVKGETDNYIVKVKFEGVLEEIRKNVESNNNKLDYRTIAQSLSRVFNSENVYLNCSCPDYKFRFAYYGTKQGYNSGKPEDRPNRFVWTNSLDNMGSMCKHGNLVLSNLSWLMKVASVINNYIHYAETYMQRQFADIIFPLIYGVSYPDALQLGLFDRQYLAHSKGVIDAINDFGKTRGRFKKKQPTTTNQDVEVRTSPKQLSIFDNVEEDDTPKDKFGNKGFKKQSIFDLGVDEVEEQPKGFKQRTNSPVKIEPKGFKKLSIFDDEEESE